MNCGSTEQVSAEGGASAGMPKDTDQSDATHQELQGGLENPGGSGSQLLDEDKQVGREDDEDDDDDDDISADGQESEETPTGAVEEGGDLTPINSMMNTVMNAGQINGGSVEPMASGDGVVAVVPIKTPSKSPSINRTGRRNQEVKEDRSTFICPLCDKNCGTQHQLTMHIRQHNTESGATDHSCSICGKALSSASSLDRHMLVHSGERPYKCSICGQTFTTNGNMHRHMKIHDKDPNAVVNTSPPSPTKRRRLSTKRKPSLEDDEEIVEQSPNKKVLLEDQAVSATGERGRGGGGGGGGGGKREEELLHCPICFKTFICKYGLESHMETHPDTTLRCNLCCITFRTHRGLLRHNSVIHKQFPTDPSGRPFIQSNPSVPLGFGDLAFIDFSCHKFPQIAQVWCETNLRRCSSKFHRFVCEVCNKAFPLQESLDLHSATHNTDTVDTASSSSTAPGGAQTPSADDISGTDKEGISHADEKQQEEEEGQTHLPAEKAEEATLPLEEGHKSNFLEYLGLQLSSKVKSGPSEEERQQAILDSIRVIHVEPPVTNLPQEASSSLGLPLLEPLSLQGLQGLGQNSALNLLSLQPLPRGFVMGTTADSNGGGGSLLVRPLSSQAGLDMQQILKMATSMSSQMTLPGLAKAAGPSVSQQQQQQTDAKLIPPVKPKPLVTPRSSVGASTPPPPSMSAQQASPGCISPSLPPPTGHLLRTPKQSSSSSSSSSTSPVNQGYGWDCVPIGSDSAATTVPYDSTGKPEEAAGKEKTRAPAKTEYPCRFCTQVFSFPAGLQAHMRHHLGASPYQCSICSYAAPDKATLIRHLRTHSGERPYVCRLCHYPFTVKANCERHLRKKHMKNTRKEIEKNIEYVTSTGSGVGATIIGPATLDLLEQASASATACRYCGEDLKNYRALQIHLRTHNGCQRKPYECRQCGAAFLAKRNCIHHLLKCHPEVPEREIEDHITALAPVMATATSTTTAIVQNNPILSSSTNGIMSGAPATQAPKHEVGPYAFLSDQDQPLDFSNKSGGNGVTVKREKVPSPQPVTTYDCSLDQPIDLSIRKDPECKRLKREVADTIPLAVDIIKKESVLGSTHKTLEENSSVSQKPFQISPTRPASALSGDQPKLVATTIAAARLKPLLPKPSAVLGSTELPPLASIAQIISSVSAAPALLKASRTNSAAAATNSCLDMDGLGGKTLAGTAAILGLDAAAEDSLGPKKKGRKRSPTGEMEENSGGGLAVASLAGALDLESSGEFPSVEKMLATTDANKFSPYLRPSAVEPAAEGMERERQCMSEEEKDGIKDKQKSKPPNKGKKNAYSNSVQKMTCPYCPRVFPWASSLQRHMLTHTGQKPYPCPQCDAFFSTKSNCERHLLRKHGVTSRLLQNKASSKAREEGSQGSAESISDTEPVLASVDAASMPLKSEGLKGGAEGHGPVLEDDSAAGLGLEAKQKALQRGQDDMNNKLEEMESAGIEDSDDAQSNKSLDVNLACKLIDFKLSPTGQPSLQQQQPQPHQPLALAPSSGSRVSQDDDEFQLICPTCNKSFRHAATLNRHLKSHLLDAQAEEMAAATKKKIVQQGKQFASSSGSSPDTPTTDSPKAEAELDGEDASERDVNSSGMETSGAEEDDRERDERSEEDEDSGSSECKGGDGESSSGGKTDKRKKICSICNKRFWSLQDLTRHIRSHTGERPFKCPTCERTFTLKHSLVRHQRIHQKPQDSKGLDVEDEMEDEEGSEAMLRDEMGLEEGEGLPCVSGSESESTPCCTNPEATNENQRTELMTDEDGETPVKEKQDIEMAEEEEEGDREQAEVVVTEDKIEEEEEEVVEGPAETQVEDRGLTKESSEATNDKVSSIAQADGAREHGQAQAVGIEEVENPQEHAQ